MTKITYRAVLGAYLLLILAVSSIPGQSLPKLAIFTFDKVLHFFEYAVLGILAIKSLPRYSLVWIAGAVLGGMLFGGLDELWQSLTPGRFSNGWDMLADWIGLWVGFSTTAYLQKQFA